MRTKRTFILSFITALSLLFIGMWSPRILSIVAIGVFAVLFVGSFVWLLAQVVVETVGSYKSTKARVLVLGVLLGLFTLTAMLSAMYVWTLIVSLVLAGCLVWRGWQDYRELFSRRQQIAGPPSWRQLERGEIPAADASHRQHAKERFAHSYEVRVTCTPRASELGLSSHPLRMDE